jgi:thiol-disulfide isomerase/thioredoxin
VARSETSEPTPSEIARSFVDIKKKLAADGKPLVVNHWATWCDPCVSELPYLASVAARHAGRIRFIGVSWDRFTDAGSDDEVREEVDSVRAQFRLEYPTIIAPADPSGFFEAFDLETQTIPQTYVWDGAGNKLWFYNGEIEGEARAAFEAAIERALGAQHQ